MSFLYARNKNNIIYIFADSKVTFQIEEQDILFKSVLKENEEDLENLKRFGIIKNVIINNNICIGFAGVLEHFNELLKFIENDRINDIERIKAKALEIHTKYNRDTDFIIASIGIPNNKLYVVKEGYILLTSSCWIGSQDTFEIFQEYRNNPDNISKFGKNLDDEIKLITGNRIIDANAFKFAINNTNDNSVGGFFIECFEKNGDFYYSEMVESYVEREHTILPFKEVIIYDNNANGGYTFHMFESKDVVSLYIKQLAKGIRYCTCIEDKKYNYLRFPQMYDLSEADFIKKFNIIEPSIYLR